MSSLLLAGALGGVVRGLVGVLKHLSSAKKTKFEFWYFATMVGLSGIIGVSITWSIVASGLKLPIVSQINPAIAFILGYAGGDFIENLYKIMIGKESLYS